MWYVKYEKGRRILYSADSSFKSINEEIEDIGYEYYVSNDGTILYTIGKNGRKLYKKKDENISVVFTLSDKSLKGDEAYNITISGLLPFDSTGETVFVLLWGSFMQEDEQYICEGLVAVDPLNTSNLVCFGNIFDHFENVFCDDNVVEGLVTTPDEAEKTAGRIATDSKEGYFNGAINAFRTGNDGELFPLGEQILMFDGDKTDIRLSVSIETSTADGNIPVNIYAFYEGVLLDIQYGEVKDNVIGLNFKENSEYDLPITLYRPKNGFRNGEGVISIIINVDPAFITDKGWMSETTNAIVYNACFTSNYVSDTWNNDEYIPKENDYIHGKGSGRLDVGYSYEHPNPDGKNTFYRSQSGPIIINSEKDSLFVKIIPVFGGEGHLWLLAFCDGSLYPLFNGKHFAYIECNNKDDFCEILNLEIAKEFFPEKGGHSIKIIAVRSDDFKREEVWTYESSLGRYIVFE